MKRTLEKEVAVATSAWAEAFADDNPDRLLALYDKKAVLWGTLSPERRDTPEACHDYFLKLFAALPGHRVTLGDQMVRVYGAMAINTGYYTFSYVKDGQTKTLPARYSFAYAKRGGRWMIVDHHSSLMPEALK